MEECQICGREAFDEAMLEGARVFLCPACLKYGKPIERHPIAKASFSLPSQKPSLPLRIREFRVVDDYAGLVVNAREKTGLTRQQLARQLFIMQNVLERIEHGHLRPDLKTAEKLEKALGIRLVEEEGAGSKENEPEKKAGENRDATLADSASQKKKGSGLTFADLVDVKVKE